jgi:hypothetical protein
MALASPDTALSISAGDTLLRYLSACALDSALRYHSALSALGPDGTDATDGSVGGVGFEVSSGLGLAAVLIGGGTLGFAAGCLKHSIPGDFSRSTAEEVLALLKGSGSGRVQR